MEVTIKDLEGRLSEGSKVQLFIDDTEVNLAVRVVETKGMVVKPHFYSGSKFEHKGSRVQETTLTLEETE